MEFRAGTDPNSGDTDNDGLGDRAEAGWYETSMAYSLPSVIYGVSTYICSAPVGTVYSGAYPFTLPFPVRLCGRLCNGGYADVHGVVRFVPGGEAIASTLHCMTGPHRMYVVLGDPVEPWCSNVTTNLCAWTNALEWACGAAAGATSLQAAASMVTETINTCGRFHVLGMTAMTRPTQIRGLQHCQLMLFLVTVIQVPRMFIEKD